MFWREHSYVAFSTTYVGYLTLQRKSAYLRRKKISCCCRCTLNSNDPDLEAFECYLRAIIQAGHG